MLTEIERKQRQREASLRWKKRNPDKVRATEQRRKKRAHDPVKSKLWRERRLRQSGYRERVNMIANSRATAIRRWLDAYKLSKGCCDCGYSAHPCALHFDHISSDKVLNVCNSKSIAQAELEIAKCVIRCANCHAVKTWKNHTADLSSRS